MSAAPTLFLIDGSNQMYRAYHAIRGLTGPDGRSTNAVYGFVTMLRKLIADHRPEFIAASFDLPAETFRSKLTADYKANRTPMPGDLAEQIPVGVRGVRSDGRADLHRRGLRGRRRDRHAGEEGGRHRDFRWRSSPATRTSSSSSATASASTTRATKAPGSTRPACQEKLGVAPSQVVDVMALMGDTIDNIKGVPGIGEKGASTLIATYGSLDELLARADEVPQKKYREALKANADQARQSRELATIRTDVDVDFEAERFRYQGPSRERCYALFSRLIFRTLAPEFAPTADSIVKDYAVVGRWMSCGSWSVRSSVRAEWRSR